MAGALGMQLEKVGHYRLGDGRGTLTVDTITMANHLAASAMMLAAILAALVVVVRYVYFSSPELAAVPVCPHGSLGDAERKGKGLASAVDFSVNGNPLGFPPGVAAAVAAADPMRYPDDGCLGLRRALAERAGLAPEAVMVGNGSIELIWLLASAYLRAGDNILIVGPTFGEYARAAAIQGARAVEYRASAANGFRPDVDEVVALARRPATAAALRVQSEQPHGHAPEPRRSTAPAGGVRGWAAGGGRGVPCVRRGGCVRS